MTEKLKVIKGPMFSSKTLKLITEAENARVVGEKVQVFKPKLDNRGEGLDSIRSKSEMANATCVAEAVENSWDLAAKIHQDTTVVIIDEVQFINDKIKKGKKKGRYGIVEVVDELLENNIRVVVAGLSRDFRREPFGPMPELLARAQETEESFAMCTHVNENGVMCKQPATETQRYVNGKPANWYDSVILVGKEEEGYAARCLDHHVVVDKPNGEIYRSK